MPTTSSKSFHHCQLHCPETHHRGAAVCHSTALSTKFCQNCHKGFWVTVDEVRLQGVEYGFKSWTSMRTTFQQVNKLVSLLHLKAPGSSSTWACTHPAWGRPKAKVTGHLHLLAASKRRCECIEVPLRSERNTNRWSGRCFTSSNWRLYLGKTLSTLEH